MKKYGTQELSKKELLKTNGGIWRYVASYLLSEILNGLQQDCSEVKCK